MKWSRALVSLIRMIRMANGCVWMAGWLVLLASSRGSLASSRRFADADVERSSASLTSTSGRMAMSWTMTTSATNEPSVSSSVADRAAMSTPAKLSKSERLRRKMERKLKRLSKQQALRKSKHRSMAGRHGIRETRSKLKEGSSDIGDRSPSTVNTVRDGTRPYVIKSTSLAENDVLAGAKTDRYVISSRDLYSRMLEIESKLLNEMVRSRDTQDVLSKHSSWLQVLNDTVAENEHNYTRLQSEVDTIRKVLRSDEEYHHSIEQKLAGLMLDIAEVNNLLSTADKRATTKLEDKVIPVESSPLTYCQHTANITQYRDCEELYHHGHTSSGVYYITPLYSSCPLPVYCDMDTPPGGWMVFQRRQDGSTNFTRNWLAYRRGFGDVTKEFWLGNDNLFLLTNQRHYQLRVDLWDFYGSRVFAEYLHFKVDGERDRYRLHVTNHTGTAPDSLHNHNEVYFSTPDRDNDLYPSYHCAREWEAGWWFSNCWFAILNGRYHNTTKVEYRGISWNDWKAEQLQRVEMKMRPSGY